MSSFTQFHYDPFVGFDRIFGDEFNARFSSCGSQPPRAHPPNSFRPKLDLHESKDSDVVTATFELPGLKSEDVTIEVHNNRLTVSGESGTSSSHEEEGYAIRERRQGKFSRALQLPLGIKPEDVKAKMENGILTVTFPKASPEQQPQRIAVQ